MQIFIATIFTFHFSKRSIPDPRSSVGNPRDSHASFSNDATWKSDCARRGALDKMFPDTEREGGSAGGGPVKEEEEEEEEKKRVTSST